MKIAFTNIEEWEAEDEKEDDEEHSSAGQPESDHEEAKDLALDAAGNVWGCSVYIGDERFLYGNIYQHSFQEIWEGSKRLNSLRWAEENFDASQCRINCRMDNINHFLWGLKRPPAHVNFI